MRRVFLFLLLSVAGLAFLPEPAFAATCNETCSSTSDCDSTCPICIGTCVSCYELGSANVCLSADNGGNSNCQWDGQNCKSITDVPEMPKKIWFILILPLAFAVIYVMRMRKLRPLVKK